MDKCASCVCCKCFRPSPWKRSVKSLYPPQSTGYEENLEAQNAEDLAKLALRNEKWFIPISQSGFVSFVTCRTLERNITRDLRKQKYGYVAVGVSAFITLVDMCNDNLFRFEISIYNVVCFAAPMSHRVGVASE